MTIASKHTHTFALSIYTALTTLSYQNTHDNLTITIGSW
jgi:hypothetical protein